MPDTQKTVGFNDKMAELLAKDEALNPALRPYIIKASLGAMINHPLVQEIIYRPQMNALINERFRVKQEALRNAIATKKWLTAIFLHERPYRFNALMEHASSMSHREYWEMVGHAWTDSENIWQNYDDWRTLWESSRPDKSFCMDDKELAALNALPDVVTIYRGIHGKGVTKRRKRIGLSWTLSRDRAVWFTKRWGDQNPQEIWEGTVRRQDIHAHFLGRDEAEIVASNIDVKVSKK